MTAPFDARLPGLPQPAAVLLLLAFAPLLAVARSPLEATSVAVAVALVLTVVGTITRMSGSRLPDECRLGMIAPLAAATAAILGLLAAAFLPGLHAALVDDLPLVAAGSLLFAGGFACIGNGDATPSSVGLLGAACIAAVIFVALGAAREWLGRVAPLALQPAGALLLLGVALAACNGIRLHRAPPADAVASGGEGTSR